MEFRFEKDTMDEVKVPPDAYYDPQTQRSVNNFDIARDTNRIPKEIIYAFAYLKKAAAIETGYVTAEEFDQWVDPSKMVGKRNGSRKR